MSLNSAGETYAQIVAQDTGLDPNVVAAWVAAESNPSSQGARENNWLNIGPGNSYATLQAGADAAGSLIRQSSYYAGIRRSVGQGPAAQLAAIAASPWDAAHYNGGANLVSVYNSMFPSSPIPVSTVTSAVAGSVPASANPSQAIGSDSECVWGLNLPGSSLPIIGGTLKGCFLTRSQGRALLGASCLMVGAGMMILGLAMLAGADKKVISIAKGAIIGSAAGPEGTVAGAGAGAVSSELAYHREVADMQREGYDSELAQRRDRNQARKEARLAGQLDRERRAS